MYTPTFVQAALFAALVLIGSHSLPQPDAILAGPRSLNERQDDHGDRAEGFGGHRGHFGTGTFTGLPATSVALDKRQDDSTATDTSGTTPTGTTTGTGEMPPPGSPPEVWMAWAQAMGYTGKYEMHRNKAGGGGGGGGFGATSTGSTTVSTDLPVTEESTDASENTSSTDNSTDTSNELGSAASTTTTATTLTTETSTSDKRRRWS